MFTCSTLLLFPYPVPADIHARVQHVTLGNVPVDVLPRLFLWFSEAKHFECNEICPPQEVQCVHMYGVAWDVLVICTNHYLKETGWVRGRCLQTFTEVFNMLLWGCSSECVAEVVLVVLSSQTL